MKMILKIQDATNGDVALKDWAKRAEKNQKKEELSGAEK